MSTSFEAQLKHHVQSVHKIDTFSTYLRQIVYGGSDGIVTTFAVIAGFTGAQSGDVATYSIITVLLFGLANLFADGTSMAVGEFLSSRSEHDVFRKQRHTELNEIRTTPQLEKEQTIGILKMKGFTVDQAKQLTEIYSKNEQYWLEFMMRYELELADTGDEKPHLNALATFFAFITFGFLPLIPYLFETRVTQAFSYSAGFAIGAMVLLGVLRWLVTRQNLTRMIGETVLLGVVSGSVAYVVGLFFR